MLLKTLKGALKPGSLVFFCLLVLFVPVCKAQEDPYFVTYSDDLEEPGNLELETKTAIAAPDNSNRFAAVAMEFEYGVRAWWTSELYLDGQATAQDSAVFTGFRLENRARLLMRDHRINPLLYVEYENISGADKTILEFVGHDMQDDMAAPNAVLRREHQHEAELKLILSSDVKDWNISENFIAEKNLGHAPWEFGYAVGAGAPAAQRGRGTRVHVLRGEAERRSRGVRRPGGHRLAHHESDLALRGPGAGVAIAKGYAPELFAKLRVDP